jgi:hypothetical protein
MAIGVDTQRFWIVVLPVSWLGAALLLERVANCGEAFRGEIEKGATKAAPFYRRVRSAYRFLPAFFFPPLAFFAIVCYPPLHMSLTDESAHDVDLVAAAWHAHPMSARSQIPSASASAAAEG